MSTNLHRPCDWRVVAFMIKYPDKIVRYWRWYSIGYSDDLSVQYLRFISISSIVTLFWEQQLTFCHTAFKSCAQACFGSLIGEPYTSSNTAKYSCETNPAINSSQFASVGCNSRLLAALQQAICDLKLIPLQCYIRSPPTGRFGGRFTSPPITFTGPQVILKNMVLSECILRHF